MLATRLSFTMNTQKFPAAGKPAESASGRADRIAVWILLALGLLLMLVSVSKAEQPAATRVDRFNGTVAAGNTIHIENVSGDIVASPGPQFTAVVTLTASAASPQKAAEILKKTQILSEHEDGGYSLETVLPGAHSGRRNGNRNGLSCDQCRVVARYEVVVPHGVDVEFQTVNGDVRVRELDGELSLETVNGSIDVQGARKGFSLQTVNGRIEAVATALPEDASVSLQSVNGNVQLTLPKAAKFEFAASTMNGTIASSFALPPKAAETVILPTGRHDMKVRVKAPKAEKGAPSKVILEDENGSREVDLEDLDQELAESMKQVEISIEQGMRDDGRGPDGVRRIEIPNPHREYSGTMGKGGADVHMETLNGRVLLLAAGTNETDVKTLVSDRNKWIMTVPNVNVRVHAPVVAPPAIAAAPPVPAPRAPRAIPPVPPVAPAPDFEQDTVRGDIAGDFLATSGGDYRIGKVSGRVKILTHSGEIRLGGAGAGADLKSFGGDIVVGPVTGDLKATTQAGDIVVDAVTGSALADTNGGDIRIERVGGSLDARTAGGDIRVPHVGGGVHASSAGGEIRIGLTGRDIKGGVTIRNDGGDVTLSLPADLKADVELVVTGADDDENVIRSEFPELAISKKAGTQRATASLNGGGERVVVRTTSGTIRLKKT
ncbi:MAG TPA: DUF4097 family beta strand repeat-containing protein [Thermoanaerobaculia bacterium]